MGTGKHTQIKKAQALREALIVLRYGLPLPTSQPRLLIKSVCGVGGHGWSDSGGTGRRDGGRRLGSVQHHFFPWAEDIPRDLGGPPFSINPKGREERRFREEPTTNGQPVTSDERRDEQRATGSDNGRQSIETR